MTRGIYDPQLTPERTVLAEKWAFIEEARGTSTLGRWGEEYILTCVCGALTVTNDNALVQTFRFVHEVCA